MSAILVATASDEDIIRFIDQWVSLLAAEKYAEACRYLDTGPAWPAELIREIIKGYGDETDNRVTLTNNGTAMDGAGNVGVARQRKEVSWANEASGDVWYDLNINGLVSDLNATFDLKRQSGRIHIILQDIHVM
jgi:hypothetical protein